MLNVQRVRKSCSQRLQLKHYTIIFIDIDICKKKMLLTHILMLQKKSNKYPCITFNLSIIFVKCNEKKKTNIDLEEIFLHISFKCFKRDMITMI